MKSQHCGDLDQRGQVHGRRPPSILTGDKAVTKGINAVHPVLHLTLPHNLMDRVRLLLWCKLRFREVKRILSRRRLEPGLAATKFHATSTPLQGELAPEWGGIARLSLIFADV